MTALKNNSVVTPGQKLRLIKSWAELAAGSVVIVGHKGMYHNDRDTYVDISSPGMCGGFFPHRFELVEEEPKVTQQPKTFAGQKSVVGTPFVIVSLDSVDTALTPCLRVGMRGIITEDGDDTPAVMVEGLDHSLALSMRQIGPVFDAVVPAQVETKAPPSVPAKPVYPKAPQTRAVLDMLKRKGSMTSIEAGGVLRVRSLSKRITELRRLGWPIIRELKKDPTGQRYARYHLGAVAS
ncbi:MAG: helix-turn-helix domain-containing protein [Pararhizobium sp.]